MANDEQITIWTKELTEEDIITVNIEQLGG